MAQFGLEIEDQRLATKLETVRSSFLTGQVTADARQALDAIVARLSTGKGIGLPHVRDQMVELLVAAEKAGVVQTPEFQKRFIQIVAESLLRDSGRPQGEYYPVQALLDTTQVAFEIANQRLASEGKPKIALFRSDDPDSAYSLLFKGYFKDLLDAYGYKLTLDVYKQRVTVFERNLYAHMSEAKERTDVAVVSRLWRETWETPSVIDYRANVVRENAATRAQLEFSPEIANVLRDPPRVAGQDVYGKALTYSKQLAARSLALAMVNDDYGAPAFKDGAVLPALQIVKDWLNVCIQVGCDNEPIEVYYDVIRNDLGRVLVDEHTDQVAFDARDTVDADIAQLSEDTGQNPYRQAQLTIDLVAPAPKTKAFLPTIRLDGIELPPVPILRETRSRSNTSVPTVEDVVVSGTSSRVGNTTYGLTDAEFEQVQASFKSNYEIQIYEYIKQYGGALKGEALYDTVAHVFTRERRGNDFAEYLRDYMLSKMAMREARVGLQLPEEITVVNRAPSTRVLSASEKAFSDGKVRLMQSLLEVFITEFEKPSARFPQGRSAPDDPSNLAEFVRYSAINMDELVREIARSIALGQDLPREFSLRPGAQALLDLDKGVGTWLTETYKNFSLEQGEDGLKLRVDGGDPQSIHFYASEAAEALTAALSLEEGVRIGDLPSEVRQGLELFTDRLNLKLNYATYEAPDAPINPKYLMSAAGVSQDQLVNHAAVIVAEQVQASNATQLGRELINIVVLRLREYAAEVGGKTNWAQDGYAQPLPLDEALTQLGRMLEDPTGRAVEYRKSLLRAVKVLAKKYNIGITAEGKLATEINVQSLDVARALVRVSTATLSERVVLLTGGGNELAVTESARTFLDSVVYKQPQLNGNLLGIQKGLVINFSDAVAPSVQAPRNSTLVQTGDLTSLATILTEPDLLAEISVPEEERVGTGFRLTDPESSEAQEQTKERAILQLEYKGRPEIADMVRDGRINLRMISDRTRHLIFSSDVPGSALDEIRILSDIQWVNIFNKMSNRSLGDKLLVAVRANSESARFGPFSETELQGLALSVDGSAEGDAVLIDFLKENIAQKRIDLSGLTDNDNRPVSFPELVVQGRGGAEVGMPVESDLQKSIRLGAEFTKVVAIYASEQATVETNTPARGAAAIFDLLNSNLGSRSRIRFEDLIERFFADNALVRDATGKTTQLRITRQTVANAVEAMNIHNENHAENYTAGEILADADAAEAIDRVAGRLNSKFVINVSNNPEIMQLEEDSLRPISVDQQATNERRAVAEVAGAERLLQLVRASGGDTRAVENTLATFNAGRTVAGDALEIAPARVRAVEAALDETDGDRPARRASPLAENEANLDFERNIAQAEGKLSRLGTAVYSLGLLGFGIFASVVGIAAGIAGIVYAASSTKLSNQAKYLTIAMNAVRVASSVLILGASAAQIAANVAKTAVEVAQATSIAERGFYLGGFIGVTTSLAQIGLQAKAVDEATDSTSRLIAGLAILDAVIQLVLNVIGLLGLAFGGPLGVVINLVTFVIGALVPSFSAIAQAVKYREVYDDLVGKGLNKEAEIVFVNWQIAVMDATPIVNWGSTIYTPEWERDQQRKMDNAWLDKAGEERLLYFVKTSTDLLRNFNELRQQLYAGAAAINQPVVNLSQGLTRATMLMLSQEDLSYFSGDITATVKLAATFNYNANKIERAPKLISAVVNGTNVTLTFNQNLATLASQLPDLTAFTVTVNGVAVTVSGFTLLNNLITLSLVTAVTAGQVVTFSYNDSTDDDDKKAVQTLLGKDAADISNHAVVNSLDTDARAPLLVDAVVQTKYLSLTFDEALDSNASKVPTKSQFSVSVGGTNANIATVAVYGSRVLLTLVDDVNTGDAVVVNYTSPSTGTHALQDSSGNKVLTFMSGSGTAVNVENITTVATVNASRVGWLQYDNFVKSVQGTGTEASSVLNGSDYTVYSNASAATNGSARLRYLSLGNVAGEFDSYSVSRADNNPDKVWLDASGALGTVSFAVNTSKMIVWGGQSYNSYSLQRDYANDAYIVAANSWSGESNVVTISSNTSSDPNANTTVNLDHLLTASDISDGLPINQMVFKVLGASDGKDRVIGTFTNQTYYATSNVANINLSGANSSVFVGESATVKVGMNARVLVDMDMWRALSAQAPTANVINGTIKGNYGSSSLLNFSSTDTINDSFMGTLDLQYTLGNLPSTDAFSVRVAGVNVDVNEVEVTDRNVVLKLAQSVEQGQTVSISYVDGGADDEDTLQSLNGIDVSSFSNLVVNNLTSDTAAPNLVSATMSSNVLWLRFDRQLNTSVSKANLKNALTVVVGGEPVLITGVSVQDNKIAVTTGTLPSRDQVVTVSYRPLVQSIVSTSGVAANSIGNFSVTNLIDDVLSPVVTSAIANDNLIVLVFSEDLRNNAISGTLLTDYSSGGFNVSGFSVGADGQNVTVNDVAISGNSLVLTLNRAVTQEQSVTVSYTAPQVASGISDGSVLRDWVGNDVSDFVIGGASAPRLISAQGYGNQVLLTYDSAL
ncbi:MAG: SwmB domain-containing protein, partial [Methylophilaceae bacterium]|nr:SwmB domain-containing protein [Methylophilaceae bacterium]